MNERSEFIYAQVISQSLCEISETSLRLKMIQSSFKWVQSCPRMVSRRSNIIFILTSPDLTFFYIRPDRVGLVRPPLAVSHLIELELRWKTSQSGVTRSSDWYLNFRSQVNRWPQEVKSMTQMSGLGFWQIIFPKMIPDPKLLHHRVCLVKSRQMISFLFRKGQVACWPDVNISPTITECFTSINT